MTNTVLTEEECKLLTIFIDSVNKYFSQTLDDMSPEYKQIYYKLGGNDGKENKVS